MIYFILGIFIGLIVGVNLEFLRNIATSTYFGKKKKENKKVNFFSMAEIKIKLFLCRIYEEKKIHLLIFFYSFLIAAVVILLSFIEFRAPSGYNYLNRFLFL
ncbi:MAG: hypothetical protein ACQESP_08770 [Candidatus Muiribacteriota bacterium]